MVACMTASGRWSPSANVPARGVEHRGDRPGVQEPVVLGEPVVVAQQQLYPKKLRAPVATPSRVGSTAFCPARTATWMKKPSPAPVTTSRVARTQTGLVPVSLLMASIPPPASTAPATGKIL